MTHGKIEDPYKALENPRFLDASKPIVLRLDGKNFSKLSKMIGGGSNSELFNRAMAFTAQTLCKEIQGARLAYVASDEMSIIIYRQTETSQVWFNGRINKIESVAASIASVAFYKYLKSNTFDLLKSKNTLLDDIWAFDARAFNVHQSLLPDYLDTRKTKTYANAWHMFARDLFSHNECKEKSTSELIEMLVERGCAPNIDKIPNLMCSFYGNLILPEHVLKTVEYLGESKTIYRRVWSASNPTMVDYKKQSKEIIDKYVLNVPNPPVIQEDIAEVSDGHE
jgi:tRNA(His) 5'-end guanylyltransferase